MSFEFFVGAKIMLLFQTTYFLTTLSIAMQVNIERDVHLQADIAAHARDTHPARHGIGVGIFQSAQMRLIDLVEQVLAGERQLDAVMPLQVQIHTGRKAQQRIVGRGSLSIIHAIEMILPEIVLHAENEIGKTEVAAQDVSEIVKQVNIP